MKTYVETKSGQYIEVVNGVLSCFNTNKNWATISDWMDAWENLEPMTIRIEHNVVFVELADTAPSGRILSLLEHFEYQD